MSVNRSGSKPCGTTRTLVGATRYASTTDSRTYSLGTATIRACRTDRPIIAGEVGALGSAEVLGIRAVLQIVDRQHVRTDGPERRSAAAVVTQVGGAASLTEPCRSRRRSAAPARRRRTERRPLGTARSTVGVLRRNRRRRTASDADATEPRRVRAVGERGTPRIRRRRPERTTAD